MAEEELPIPRSFGSPVQIKNTEYHNDVLPPATPLRGKASNAARGLRMPSDGVSCRTIHDMILYKSKKDEMLSEIRKNGSVYFLKRLNNSFCGLVNQGATCYLNSLVQSLFMTKEFRKNIYEWEHDPTRHGIDTSKCIPFQLQRLFARMECSTQHSVSTKVRTRLSASNVLYSLRHSRCLAGLDSVIRMVWS
jgi:hypothetical protein